MKRTIGALTTLITAAVLMAGCPGQNAKPAPSWSPAPAWTWPYGQSPAKR
jgi:hypothetical protein